MSYYEGHFFQSNSLFFTLSAHLFGGIAANRFFREFENIVISWVKKSFKNSAEKKCSNSI